MNIANNRKVILVYPEMIVGGAEILILRISEAARQLGCFAKVICISCDDALQSEFDSIGVEVTQTKRGRASLASAVSAAIEEGLENTVVTFYWHDYLQLRYLSKRRCKIILYAVHPQCVVQPYLNNIKQLKRRYQRIVKQCIEHQQLVFMDEEARDTALAFHGLEGDRLMPIIVRLPVKAPASIRKEHYKQKGKVVVLSVARADFPFKGYLLGLVDLIKSMQSRYDGIELAIVSYGPDIDALIKRIGNATGIILASKTMRSDLDQLYQKADLYIGMGTTVLEAASFGVPSVPVAQNTNSLVVGSMFHENPNSVTFYNSEPGDAEQIVESFLLMEQREYDELSKSTKEAFESEYDMCANTAKLISIADNSSFFSSAILVLEGLARRIRSIVVQEA